MPGEYGSRGEDPIQTTPEVKTNIDLHTISSEDLQAWLDENVENEFELQRIMQEVGNEVILQHATVLLPYLMTGLNIRLRAAPPDFDFGKELVARLPEDTSFNPNLQVIDDSKMDVLIQLGQGEWAFAHLAANAADSEAESFDTLINTEASELRKKITRSIGQYQKDVSPEQKIDREFVKQALDSMNQTELFFFAKIIEKNKVNEHTVSVLQGLMNGEQFIAPIAKTGSDLHIFGASKDAYLSDEKGERLDYRPIAFIHTINSEAAGVWEKLHEDGYPVAPICAPIMADGENRLVVSRYCGPSLRQFEEYLAKNKSESTLPLLDLLKKYVRRTAESVDLVIDTKEKAEHQHFHEGNIVVEWIKDDYAAAQISEGKNNNQIPYNPNEFTFDPYEFLKNPRAWRTVVRIIDWDAAYDRKKIGDGNRMPW